MSKKNLILRAALLVILTGMIAVAVSLAWFRSATINRVNDFSIEVGSADTFELSLDGINYNRQLNIQLFNKDTTINDTIYDSSVELADISSVYESVTSVGGKTFKSLKLVAPTRDEYSGEPILNTTSQWDEAVKSKIVYNSSDGKYYVVSSSEEEMAQYLELDLWIRSDSNLEIYLGDESKILPYKETSEENVIPAMYSVEQRNNAYTLTKYVNASNHNIPYYSVLIMGDTTYYFSDSVNQLDNEVIDNTFVIKAVARNINSIDYKYYYDENDQFIAKSRVIDGYECFYNSSDSFKFKTKFVDNGSYKENHYYNDVNVEIDSDIEELVNNDNLYDYLSFYALDSIGLYHGDPVVVEESSNVYFYDEAGNFLIRKYTQNNVSTYYDNENPAEVGNVVNLGERQYKVISQSNYGITRNTKYGDTAILSTISQVFSKNLSAGAALVSFSELVTDTFGVNEETREVEDIRYVWNPLPYYHLQTEAGQVESEFSITDNAQTINYYVYDSVNQVYTLESWPVGADSDLVKLGSIQTDEFEVKGGESPLCTTVVEEGNKFCIRKVRIKLWIDGNNELAQNSMLNSSATRNGKMSVAIKLVSNVNRTLIEQTEVVGNGVYKLQANKINGVEEEYTWAVSDTFWNYSPEYIFRIADVTVDPLDSSKATLTFVRNGTVTVYATDSQGRVGTYVATYNYGRIVVTHTEDTNVYEFYAVNVDGSDSSTKLGGVWKISNNTIADITYDENTKIATVTFSDSGSLRVSCSLVIEVEVANDVVIEYTVELNYDIVHTFVGSGE
jgi:hypothetical protein